MKRPLLVLGATSQIGMGVVQAAVEAGRPIIAIACDSAGLHALASMFARECVHALAAPVTDDDSATALAQHLRAMDRPIDGVIATLCNGTARGRLLDQPCARLRETLDQVLIPHLAAARHLLPLLATDGRSGSYVLIDGPGGEHPWAGYGHRSVGAAAVRMLARVLHDEARALPVRVQMLSVDMPVRTDANAAHACAQWPSALSIGRRALALVERRDGEGATPLVHCANRFGKTAGLTLAQAQAPASAATRAPDPDIAGTHSASRLRSDVRALLETIKSNHPTKGDVPR